MAFEKRQKNDIFKFENKGDSLTGYYLGSQDFQGDFAPTKKHLFKTENGVKVVIGQAYLTQELTGTDPVKVGTLVRITLEGSKKTGKGQAMKTYSLEVDPENVLDESEVGNAVDASEESDEEYVAASSIQSKGPSADKVAQLNAMLRKSS